MVSRHKQWVNVNIFSSWGRFFFPFLFSFSFRFSADIGGDGGGGGGGGSGAAMGPSAEQATRMTKFVNRLVWYPVVLVASWTFATINRIQNAVEPDRPVFGLFLLHVSGVVSFRCDAGCSATSCELVPGTIHSFDRCFVAQDLIVWDGFRPPHSWGNT